MTHDELLRSFFATNKDNHRLEAELKAALDERDEARREVCRFEASIEPTIKKTLHFIALARGWDCYDEQTKEENNMMSDPNSGFLSYVKEA
jgi:hypothetical protein